MKYTARCSITGDLYSWHAWEWWSRANSWVQIRLNGQWSLSIGWHGRDILRVILG